MTGNLTEEEEKKNEQRRQSWRYTEWHEEGYERGKDKKETVQRLRVWRMLNGYEWVDRTM